MVAELWTPEDGPDDVPVIDDIPEAFPENVLKLGITGANLNGSQTAEGAFTLTTQTAASLCAEPDSDNDQLLGPLVLAGGRTIIVGDTGQGKTTLAFQLIRTVLNGDTFLDWQGHGNGRALVIDLEQGRRSVKRGLRDAGLDTRNDVDLVLVPDGLSLDKDPEHLAELDRVIGQGGYTIVDLDPYYKAHRADEPNAERPIVDLMRTLDSLRSRHGFALLLPAHPRKDIAGASSVRKLTIHDIAGSGAVTRGAELVLGIERVAHGLARLRFLKDREGDLPIGEAWNLVYHKAAGFSRDPKDNVPARNYSHEILNLSADGDWRTMRDYMDALKAGDKTLRLILNQLVADSRLEYQEGPEGRNKTAKCWRNPTASALQMHLNAADAPTEIPREDLAAASGVFPVRGNTQDEAAVLSPPTLHSDAEADEPPEQHDGDWLDELAQTVDLDTDAGALDDG